MSVLDDALEAHRVHRWDGDLDADLWAEALRREEIRLVAVEGKPSKEAMLDALAQVLRFPEWFGRNLDALADLLGEIDGDTVLVWNDWNRLAEADPGAFDGILAVLRERAADPGFGVLLRGDGPALDVPVLAAG